MVSRPVLFPFALLLAAAPEPPTAIEPAISAPQGASCALSVHTDPCPKGDCEAGGGTTRVEVPPGRYLVFARCELEEAVLAPPPVSVTVKAEQIARPKIAVERAQMRLESRRGGVLLPAHVDVFPAKSNFDGESLVRLPSNRTVLIAPGRYDLLVTLADDDAPRAEVALRNVAVRAKRKAVFSADLSDGGVVVRARCDGRTAEAAVRAFIAGRERDVGSVTTGEELRLPPGRYRIDTELLSSFDYATNRKELWIQPGRTQKITESFTTGQLAVAVTSDGAAVPATVRISRPGAADFFNYFEAPGPVTLSPGRYTVAIDAAAAGPLGEQRRDVEVRRKRTTKERVDFTRATLVVRVVKNGRPVGFAEVRVHAAGGGDAVKPEADGAFRLWPGRYEITAKLESGATLTDGPFDVALGEKVTRQLAFDRAFLTVRARRGSTAVSAKVFVYKHGATKPLAEGPTDVRIEVRPGVYDLKVVAGTDSRWQQNVKIDDSKTVTIDLPEEAEAELPEGDAEPE
ncbi:MAG: hypothetical protein RIT81_30845 [Deltaproteobacteria bacterium]